MGTGVIWVGWGVFRFCFLNARHWMLESDESHFLEVFFMENPNMTSKKFLLVTVYWYEQLEVWVKTGTYRLWRVLAKFWKNQKRFFSAPFHPWKALIVFYSHSWNELFLYLTHLNGHRNLRAHLSCLRRESAQSLRHERIFRKNSFDAVKVLVVLVMDELGPV